MSMPTIPKEPHRPNIKEVTIDLLESIALEEIALSHIMNAEAEKIQAFVGKSLDFPTEPKNKEIIKFNQGVNRLLETIVMKEWLLLNKLENVLDFFVDDSHECDCDTDKHHSSGSSGSRGSSGRLSSSSSGMHHKDKHHKGKHPHKDKPHHKD